MSYENPWKTLRQRVIYENPWFRVREDDVISPGGHPATYSVIEPRVATGIVALTDENEVYLVGQYRYPLDEYSWEIPEGGAEPDEDPLLAAQRELHEETGLSASSWEPLGGEFHVSNCISAERCFLYLARGLTVGVAAPDETEILQVRKISFNEALAMVDRGEIKDSISIIGLLRASRMFSVK